MIKISVHVEVLVKPTSSKSNADIIQMTKSYLLRNVPVLVYEREVKIAPSDELCRHVDRVYIQQDDLYSSACSNNKPVRISYWQADIKIFPIRLIDQLPEKDYIDGGGGEDETSAFELWSLPNKHLHGLWDSIIVDGSLKQNLIGYCDTSIRFALLLFRI